MSKDMERLIVALDVTSMERLVQSLDRIGDAVVYYKIGMEAFYGLGEQAVLTVSGRGKKLFLDLKLHDIPNTVAGGIKSLCRYSPSLTTVHAAGGTAMLKAAVDAAQEGSAKLGVARPKVLGITVLTSINEADWSMMGNLRPLQDTVLRLAEICQEAGLDGVVASPQEAAAIRSLCGKDFLIVTPGIRPAQGEKGDQSRIATPAKALQDGADFLVVGRPILAAEDPRSAALAILKEMEG